MSRPDGPMDVPRPIRRLAGGDELKPVWRNNLGGFTFRGADRYYKWQPRNDEFTLAGEADRLRWARPWTPVPEVLDLGGDDDGEWLVTRALPGHSAVSPHWVARPARAAHAVGRGLRALHEALPVADCPFDWGVATRIENARQRGLVVPVELETAPEIDELVVCHGDACCPNTLLDDDGHWSAHVDLTALGVADRWADLAVAAMSTEWNYGPGWEDAVLDGYGIAPDRARLDRYRRLWNAT